MEDDTNPRGRAIAALAEIFFESVLDDCSLADFESNAIDVGHECIAEALGLALEAYDARLMGMRPASLKTHDVRSRTLATEVGDVHFSIRRYRDIYGGDVYLLADELDIPYGCRVSPGAVEFLVSAASNASYAKAAALLARHGSRVEPTTVMRCMREAGALCEAEDVIAANSLYIDGVVPDAERVAEDICMEADGTYFRAQGQPVGAPTRFEVKAMCAYAGKSVEGGKVRRRGCVHHALVGAPESLWSEGVASMGEKYDLSKVKHVHLGADGERWCRDAERFLPNAEVTFHLDPFHVNRAVLSCFSDAKMAWSIIECIDDGGKRAAMALLKSCLNLGVAREAQTRRVISYLEGNIDAIAIDGPSLGTMESENQHLYGVRMDSFPCAWSLQGASDMARIISRKASKRPIPRMTRERSAGNARRKRREARELAFYERQGGAGRVVESEGSGYLPPHQADTRKMSKGKAYALYEGMAKLDRGI